MAIELVTFKKIKDLLGLEGTVMAEYPALDVIRAGVTSAIEEYLGRMLEQAEYTETKYIGCVATRMISLEAIPIVSVSSVTMTCYGEDTTLTSSDYRITDYGIELYVNISNCNLTVVYTGGWEDSDVPAAVARAALIQTSYEFQSKEQIGAESVTTEGGSVSRPALGLLKEVRRMLNRHKHPLRF